MSSQNSLHISWLQRKADLADARWQFLGGSVPEGTVTSKIDGWRRQAGLERQGDMQ